MPSMTICRHMRLRPAISIGSQESGISARAKSGYTSPHTKLCMRTDAQQGIILNIVVGIVGAVIAGLLFGGSINAGITVTTFLYSLVGAIILLAIVNLIRRGTVR